VSSPLGMGDRTQAQFEAMLETLRELQELTIHAEMPIDRFIALSHRFLDLQTFVIEQKVVQKYADVVASQPSNHSTASANEAGQSSSETDMVLCGFESGITGLTCVLAPGHKADSASRFHRFLKRG
jgi:hypothetical protein